MSYHLTTDWRNKHNRQFDKSSQNYAPMYHSIASYCTEAKTEKLDSKSDLNEIMHHSNYITHLHMLSNPLQKNLADELPEKAAKTPSSVHPQGKRNITPISPTKPKEMPAETYNTTLGSIGSFITGVFNVISSAMPFQRRPKTPDRNFERAHDGSPPLDFWLSASDEMQNKNNCRDQLNIQLCPNTTHDCADTEMSAECHTAAVNCEDKLNKVRMLLVSKPAENPQAKVKTRRPKKVFVEPKSVEEGFADAFTPEDFVSLSNDQDLECVSSCNHVSEPWIQVEGARMKTEFAPLVSTEIVKPIEECIKDMTSDVGADEVGATNGVTDSKREIILDEVEKMLTSTEDITPGVTVNKENTETDIVSTQSASETLPKVSIDTKTQSQTEELTLKETITVALANEDPKSVIIQSCEDKVSRLKALLQQRRKNNSKINQSSSDSAPEPVAGNTEHRFQSNKPIDINKTQNKHFKNPNRLSVDRRTKSNMRRDIREDMSFANEVDLESSSAEASPQTLHLPKPKFVNQTGTDSKAETPTKTITESPQTDKTCYFNEISGRFRNSSTTESEDSFQIVFTDSPQLSPRTRRLSDCDSEDSFIIFEELDSCYTSADVFTHYESDTDHSDYDTDESDHPPCRLSHNLSRTVSDLTDDSLYESSEVQHQRPYSDSEDEVDSSVKLAQPPDVSDIVVKDVKNNGLLLDAAKKLERKSQPPKRVRFSTSPPKVHVMRVWAFAARQARAGHWEQHAVDRERFKRKIADVDMAVSWVLKPQHRNRIKFQRFMPWWHAERRRELAEKKEREAAEEKRRLEEEAQRLEEEQRRIEEEKVAAEERKRVEEERRLVEIEEARKRIEKEKIKAEQKRLTEMNRQRLLQIHMKSEAQRAAEVSRRRTENEMKRKEEERYRLEAKQVAEELKKKMEEEKLMIEEEIARLAAEKDKLERGKEAVAGDESAKENMTIYSNTEEIRDGSPSVHNELDLVVANANIHACEDSKHCQAGNSVGSEVPKDSNDTKENSLARVFIATEEVISREELEGLGSILKKDKCADTLENAVLKTEVGRDDMIILNNNGKNMSLINDGFKEFNSADSHTAGVCTEREVTSQQSNFTRNADDITFLNCVDKLIVADDSKSVDDFCKNNNSVEHDIREIITNNSTGVYVLENSPEAPNENNGSEATKENNLTGSLTLQKESNNADNTTKTKTVPENVKSVDLKIVKPAMKKIQLTQNFVSSADVDINSINDDTLNVDRNMNTINHVDGVSPVLVNENLNVPEQY